MWTRNIGLGAVFGLAFLAGMTAGVLACGHTSSGGFDGTNAGDGGGADGGDVCQLCVTNADCNGGKCVQLAGDSYCEEPCPNGNECTADDTCATETTVEGEQVSVCIPRSEACGTPVGPPAEGGGCTAAAPADMCGSLAGPSITSMCNGCGSSGKTCQPNGCYGGWYCNTATNKCQAPPSPSMCPPPTSTCDAGPGGSIIVDAGGPVTGTVGANGGSVSRLFFGVVGDTRPPIIDDTKGYPSAVASRIWTDLQNVSPRPLFVVSTGDYMFASANGTQAGPQMDLYLAARAGFTNTVFPAMGNHECTGAVTSNCGPGTTDGMTNNYSVFMSKLLAPLGKTTPNYSVEIDAQDKSWTSKFVFIAGNAWTTSDSTWLTGVMAQKTTYTFVIRHEPKAAASPGTGPSEAIMAQYPYTLAIVGHTHTYGKTGPKQVTIGNGGAPLVGSVNYGYGLIQQRADGTIQVDMIDSTTGKADAAFRFALHPDGTPAM